MDTKKRLMEVLAMVDEDHFAIVENDWSEIYSKKEFYATPTPKPACNDGDEANGKD